MDLERHYPQNTISHCIISNATQITLHFIQGRISDMPGIRADLFLAISKTGMCLLTFSIFEKTFGFLGQVWYLIVSIPDLCTLTYFYYFGSRLAKVWKKMILIKNLKLDEISYGSG